MNLQGEDLILIGEYTIFWMSLEIVSVLRLSILPYF